MIKMVFFVYFTHFYNLESVMHDLLYTEDFEIPNIDDKSNDSN